MLFFIQIIKMVTPYFTKMAASLQMRFLYKVLRHSKRKCSLRTFSRTSAVKRNQQADERTTHFGYQTVTEEEKEKKGILKTEQVLALRKKI